LKSKLTENISINEAIKTKAFKSDFQKALVNIFFTYGFALNSNNKLLKCHQLSVQQYNILRILRGQHPASCNANLLIHRMFDKNSNVSRLIEKLRLKGFVNRKASESDRRQIEVNITDLGLDTLKEIDDKFICFENRFSNFTKEEFDSLNYLLDKFRNTLNN